MNRSLPCGYYFLQKIDYSKEITRAGCFLICSKSREKKHTHAERQTNKQTKDLVLQILSHVRKQHFAASMPVVIFAGRRIDSLLTRLELMPSE